MITTLILAILALLLLGLCALAWVDAQWQEMEWMVHPGNDDELNGPRHVRKPEDV